uniref:Nanos-type domain-containing protein n=1 Tax=Syphacia muris TaxID=451379 RepID=A0A0N5AN60_9BILA
MFVPINDIQPVMPFRQYNEASYLQSDYTAPFAMSNLMYNVAVPCSNSLGCSQLPVVMRLEPSHLQASSVPIQLAQDPEFSLQNSQQRAFYNVAIPSQNAAPQLQFLMRPSSQAYPNEQLQQATGSNAVPSKGSKFNLHCVPTVRIGQNSQFSATHHRNLISLTATPPTTSGSLPKSRSRHNLNQEIHNANGVGHARKARQNFETSNPNNSTDCTKSSWESSTVKGTLKSSNFLKSDIKRETEVKQNCDVSKDLLDRKSSASTWSSKIPSNLSARRFNGCRSYFPEEGSSPVTAMLHCGFCCSNNEAEEVFRSHNSHDELGRTICPKLRQVVCSYCKATGDRAHTAGFCRSKRDVARFL